MRYLLPALLLGLLNTATHAQNSCATALAVGEGVHTVVAIDGQQMVNNNCPYGNGSLAEWYTFTSPVDTGVVINTSIVGPPFTDTRIQVYTGSCSGLACLTGDDDSGTDYASICEFRAEANTTYYFNFDNNWSTNGFQFSIGLTTPPPPPVNRIDFVPVTVPGFTFVKGVCDMNNDGLDDLISPATSNVRFGYQQPNGTFQIADIATPAADHTPSWSMCVGDIDKNGANDMMYGGGQGVTFMMANATGTAFSEVSYQEYVFCQRTNLVDLNNDGNLDAFSCHDVDANVAFINDGAGNLAFEQGGYGETCGNYGSVFTDYNNDGLVDLFVAKCGCDPEDLLMPNSTGGNFTNVAPALGLADDHQSWSSAWGDFDNDGDMDAMIGTSSGTTHKLMRNNNDGTFTDVANQVGVNANDGQSIEWNTHDYDNDGWLDILGGDGILMNNGDGTFTFDNTAPLGGPIGDLDNDGYLDVVQDGTIHYNQSTGNNWLRLNLVGSVSNSNGIGARIRVTTPAGPQIRDVKSGDGFWYMNSLLTHFGLGTATSANVEIRWPSGIVDELIDVDLNEVLTVFEGTFTSTPEIDTPSLALFPVPATDRLMVSGPDANNRVARIFSSTGQLVHTSTVRGNALDIQKLESGVYLLEITTPAGALKKSFVKE